MDLFWLMASKDCEIFERNYHQIGVITFYMCETCILIVYYEIFHTYTSFKSFVGSQSEQLYLKKKILLYFIYKIHKLQRFFAQPQYNQFRTYLRTPQINNYKKIYILNCSIRMAILVISKWMWPIQFTLKPIIPTKPQTFMKFRRDMLHYT